jgi:hypothetical protein
MFLHFRDSAYDIIQSLFLFYGIFAVYSFFWNISLFIRSKNVVAFSVGFIATNINCLSSVLGGFRLISFNVAGGLGVSGLIMQMFVLEMEKETIENNQVIYV